MCVWVPTVPIVKNVELKMSTGEPLALALALTHEVLLEGWRLKEPRNRSTIPFKKSTFDQTPPPIPSLAHPLVEVLNLAITFISFLSEKYEFYFKYEKIIFA